MRKRNNSIIISGILVAFLVGTIFSSPNYAVALPPWANDILVRIGILETTTASLQTQIDNIELTPGPPGVDGADGLSCENQLAIFSQIQEFTPDPVCLGAEVCVDAVDCILPNVLESQCLVGQCEIVQCEDGFVDVDQVTSNGCEEFFSPPGTGTCSTQELTTLGNCGAICQGDSNCLLVCIQNAVPPISSQCLQGTISLGLCVTNHQTDGCSEAFLNLTPNQCIIDFCSSEWETVFGEPPTLPNICEGEPPGPAPSQIEGDCQVLECDGSDGAIVIVDDNDIPDDFNECTNDFCQNGAGIFANEPFGTLCEQGLGMCDGNGQCVPQCGINEVLCGDLCTNPSTDVNNCGVCGFVCESEQSCVSGVCTSIPQIEELLNNGSFETGDYTGWTLLEIPTGDSGTWGIVTDGQTIDSGDSVFDFFDSQFVQQSSSGLPKTFTTTDGTLVAIHLSNGPGEFRLYQDVTLSSNAVNLTWDMLYDNLSPSFVIGIQELVVNIRDPATDAILATTFSTTGVDPLSLSVMTPFVADISAFAGQIVRIDFTLHAQHDFFDLAIDNVRIGEIP